MAFASLKDDYVRAFRFRNTANPALGVLPVVQVRLDYDGVAIKERCPCALLSA